MDERKSPLDLDDDATEPETSQLLFEEKSVRLPKPHVFNSDYHSPFVRYGVPIFLVATFALLMASDIGVGASAHVDTSINGKVMSSKTNLEISVFTSIGRLWEHEAYALAVLIVCTSISWPYVKLAMTLYAWIAPFDVGCRRRHQNPAVFLAERERTLFWLDVLGKFAFVDSFVLIVLMVVFRATITILFTSTDIWVSPRVSMAVDCVSNESKKHCANHIATTQWGMYGFIAASILSLFGTQIVLHLHRGVCRQLDEHGDKATLHSWEGKKSLIFQSGYHPVIVLLALASSAALVVVGSTVDTFKFIYSGLTSYSTTHSVISIGLNIPETARDNGIMIHLLQAFYFILTMGVPLISCCVYGVLFFVKVNPHHARRLFVLAETALAWSALDVYVLSTVFAVIQVPNFARHLVDEYCKSCFTIKAEIDPLFAVTCAGALMNFFVGFSLVNKAQKTLFAVESVGLCCNGPHNGAGSQSVLV
jgi:hypothetical protein